MSSVNIVAYTQAKVEAEDFIAYCARVSNPENQNNSKTAPKLLAYLIKNQHWSPFEMASVTMEITTTRDISVKYCVIAAFPFKSFLSDMLCPKTFACEKPEFKIKRIDKTLRL